MGKVDYAHDGWDPHRMIHYAESLQRVANHLTPDPASDESDDLLFVGRIIAPPILLSLATEIALKALQCNERGAAPDLGHDLLKLFEGLTEETKNWLESRFPTQPVYFDESRFPPINAGLRDTLEYHKSAFLNWRYLHESVRADFCSTALDKALSVIIECNTTSRRKSMQD